MGPRSCRLARREWRRQGLRAVAGRLAGEHGRHAGAAVEEVEEVVDALTGLATFADPAGRDRSPEGVAALLRRVAGLDPGA